MPSYWSCRKCSFRNERTASRTCSGCGEQTKPKRRVPRHAEVLRDTPYERFVVLNDQIHGAGESCAVCGRPPSENRRLDRDHDHRTGQARGLTCVRCNRELLRNATLDQARAVVAYLERVDSFYAGERIEV